MRRTIEQSRTTGPSHQIHHTRVSGKFAFDGHPRLEAVVIRHFTDAETPHYRFGIQFSPSALTKVENGLGIPRMEHL